MTNTATLLLTLLIFLDLMLPNRSSGQGSVAFNNIGAPGAITNSLTGQPAESGTTFRVALYFAQDGITDEAQLAQIGLATGILISAPGYFNGGIRTAPTLLPGGFAMFQVRAWESAYGATYEEALANPFPQNGRLALAGRSGIMRVDCGDPTTDPPGAPGSLVHGGVPVVGAPLTEGFVLTVVPEPHPVLLILLGLPGLWLLRRHVKPRAFAKGQR